MKTRHCRTVRELRAATGLTQTEFAKLIGASKDAVVSWENGRSNLSVRFALAMQEATGAEPGRLLKGQLQDWWGQPYGPASYKRWRGTYACADEKLIEDRLADAADMVGLIFRAARQPARGGKVRDRFFQVYSSLARWAQQTRDEFGLGDAIDAELRKRERETSTTLPRSVWREDRGLALRWGYKDSKGRPADELVTLTAKVWPVWIPHGSMRVK